MPALIPSSEAALREAVADVCRRLHARDLIGAAEGNVSARLPFESEFLVTPSAVSKASLAPDHLVVVDEKGRIVRGVRRASTEIRMHLAAYAARPDVHAAVHAHPITAVGLTVAGAPPPDDVVAEAAVTLGPIARVPFATPGTDELPAALAPFLPAHDVFLLERHGALCLGRTLDEAFERMETLERVARIALVARLAGSCTPLPPEAVAKVLAAAGKPPRGAA